MSLTTLPYECVSYGHVYQYALSLAKCDRSCYASAAQAKSSNKRCEGGNLLNVFSVRIFCESAHTGYIMKGSLALGL